jgi:hypothetical protein
MPIEIKELHIQVAVNAAPAASAGPADQGPGAGGKGGGPDNSALVAECVEQVLQILQTKSER